MYGQTWVRFAFQIGYTWPRFGSSVRLTTPCFDDKDIKREDDDFLTPETEQLCEMLYLPEGLSVYVFLLAADEPNPTVYCAFICRLKSEKKPTRNKLY